MTDYVKQPIPKGLRFDVFNRDGFTCIYCGRRPPSVILHCDHIIPESEDGPTVMENLTTSCADCNRGKSTKKVLMERGGWEEKVESLGEQVEQLEQYKIYLDRILDFKNREHEIVLDHWKKIVHDEPYEEIPQRLRAALAYLPSHEIMQAIDITMNKFQYRNHRPWPGADFMKYFHGVMRNMRKEHGQAR